MFNLPLEIIEIIVDILTSIDDNKLSSTKACSLVCHTLCTVCQKRIFATVHLGHPVPSRRASPQMLQHLLSVSPALGGLIRSLEYSNTSGSDDLADPALVNTFEKITQLRSLQIWVHQGIPNFDSSLWNAKMRRALLPLLRLPTLRELSLQGVPDFNIADLKACAFLEYFECGDGTFAPTPLPSSPLLVRKLCFTSNSMASATYLVGAKCSDGRPLLDFHQLSNLVVWVLEPTGITTAEKILGVCDHLETLSLFIDAQFNISTFGLPHAAALSTTQMLKRIAVTTVIIEDTTFAEAYLTLADGLQSLAHKNALEVIALHIWMGTGTEHNSTDEWERIDDVLGQSGWPHLRRVSMSIMDDGQSEQFQATVREAGITRFPRLSSSKIVSFEFSPKPLK